jgi:hypothetical protein
MMMMMILDWHLPANGACLCWNVILRYFTVALKFTTDFQPINQTLQNANQTQTR